MNWIEKRLGCSLRSQGQMKDTDVTGEADLLDVDRRALEILAAIGDTLPDDARDLLRGALAS